MRSTTKYWTAHHLLLLDQVRLKPIAQLTARNLGLYSFVGQLSRNSKIRNNLTRRTGTESKLTRMKRTWWQHGKSVNLWSIMFSNFCHRCARRTIVKTTRERHY